MRQVFGENAAVIKPSSTIVVGEFKTSCCRTIIGVRLFGNLKPLGEIFLFNGLNANHASRNTGDRLALGVDKPTDHRNVIFHKPKHRLLS